MVNNSAASLDATFGALADPTRRAILSRLAETPEVTVTDLARPFDVSLPAISRHLRVLEEAGLIARRRDGRVHHCRVVAAPMKPASEWIARYQTFWEEKLDALARYLEETADEDEPAPDVSRRARRRRGATFSRRRPRKH
ncbi:MAG TPA: metalloregulator ArsR/SmtB family transcription factor [Thermoanaerobaculia bacterium]|nr:metalloregulator ArsR/SmtB family transcription factor [Thermoanaerobaculia bacterium]